MNILCGKYKVFSTDFFQENSICMKRASKRFGLHHGSKIEFIAQFPVTCHHSDYGHFQQYKNQGIFVQFLYLFSSQCLAKCPASLWTNNYDKLR